MERRDLTLVEMKDTMQAVRACWVVSSSDWILLMNRTLLLQVTATPRISLRNLEMFSSPRLSAWLEERSGRGKSPAMQSSVRLCL